MVERQSVGDPRALNCAAELRSQIGAINPGVIFVQGLAGIPGLIVGQVQGAFAADDEDATRAPAYTPHDRTIRLTLPNPFSIATEP